VYIVACLLGFLHLLPFFFTYFSLLIYFLTYLSFENRSALRFQAGGRNMRSNLGLSCFSLFRIIVFYVPDAWLFCVVVNLVIRVGPGLVCIVVTVLTTLFSQY